MVERVPMFDSVFEMDGNLCHYSAIFQPVPPIQYVVYMYVIVNNIYMTMTVYL